MAQTTSLRGKWKFRLPHYLSLSFHAYLWGASLLLYVSSTTLWCPRLHPSCLFAIFIPFLYGQLTPRLDVVTLCWYKYLMMPSFVCLLIFFCLFLSCPLPFFHCRQLYYPTPISSTLLYVCLAVLLFKYWYFWCLKFLFSSPFFVLRCCFLHSFLSPTQCALAQLPKLFSW